MGLSPQVATTVFTVNYFTFAAMKVLESSRKFMLTNENGVLQC